MVRAVELRWFLKATYVSMSSHVFCDVSGPEGFFLPLHHHIERLRINDGASLLLISSRSNMNGVEQLQRSEPVLDISFQIFPSRNELTIDEVVIVNFKRPLSEIQNLVRPILGLCPFKLEALVTSALLLQERVIHPAPNYQAASIGQILWDVSMVQLFWFKAQILCPVDSVFARP